MHRSRWNEAIGRMQSGGAISIAEEKRFKGMMPKPGDSPKRQREKLQDMLFEMNQRGRDFDAISDYKVVYGSPAEKPGTKLAGPQTDEDLNNMSEEELVDYTEGRGKYANK